MKLQIHKKTVHVLTYHSTSPIYKGGLGCHTSGQVCAEYSCFEFIRLHV